MSSPHSDKIKSDEVKGSYTAYNRELHLQEVHKEVSSPVSFELDSTDHLNMLQPVHSLVNYISTYSSEKKSVTYAKYSCDSARIRSVFPLLNDVRPRLRSVSHFEFEVGIVSCFL